MKTLYDNLSAAIASIVGDRTTHADEAQRRHALLKQFHALRQRQIAPQNAAALLRVSLKTIRNWQKQFRRRGIEGLYSQSRRPHHCKRYDLVLYQRVVDIRNLRHCGKEKIGVMMRNEGLNIADSTIGRMLGDAAARGEISELLMGKKQRRYRNRPEHCQVRSPHTQRWCGFADYDMPGACVQVDTMHVMMKNGRTAYLVNFLDGYSRYVRWWCVEKLNSAAVAAMVKELVREGIYGYAVRSFQVDGGPEFRGEFERMSERCGVDVVLLPKGSPHLNGYAESYHSTQRRECLNAHGLVRNAAELVRVVSPWVDYYNRERPHASLGMRSPLQYLQSPKTLHDR